jgi:chromosome segregation ATPase
LIYNKESYKGDKLTPEEAVEYYNMEQRNYYEYCSYIQNYQNRIGELQSERQNKSILADEKQTEIQRNQELYDSISNTNGSKEGLFSHLTKINGKVQEAAANFSVMVSSSTVKAFNLEETFGENATNANSKLTEVFDFINSGKSSVSQMIETLNQELQTINSQIQEIDMEIRNAQYMIDQYESSKQTALVNMAYYERIIQQA